MISADAVASVIISRSGRWLDAWSLQKLLYYVQAWHVAVTDAPLFPEKIKAWEHGPVVPQVWHSRKDQSTRSAANQHISDVDLDETTSNLIDLVLGSYGSMTGQELSALTHVEQPWRDARGALPENARSGEQITLESMARFYREHRQLGGRTAADLAAAGVFMRSREAQGPVDVDALLASLGEQFDDPGDHPWGSSSSVDPDTLDYDGIEQQRRHSRPGV